MCEIWGLTAGVVLSHWLGACSFARLAREPQRDLFVSSSAARGYKCATPGLTFYVDSGAQAQVLELVRKNTLSMDPCS